jgi:hypothetical protein
MSGPYPALWTVSSRFLHWGYTKLAFGEKNVNYFTRL